jgi:hypothetical protein
MTRPASVPLLRAEFNDFLFAPIGEERNGMLLTVLSALARLDVDPWQEAANLARLPGQTATVRLASLIAALPDGPSVHLDPGTLAARLIALLPRRAGPNIPPRETLLGVGAVANPRHVINVIVINVLFMAFMLGTQWIMAGRQPSAQVDNAHAPVSSTVLPPPPPPNAGQ